MGFWDDLWGNLKDNVDRMGGMSNVAGPPPIVHTNHGLFGNGGAGGSFGSRPKPKSTLKEERREASSTPWKSGDGGVKADPTPAPQTPGLSIGAVDNSAITEGYLREIQDRLANSRAVAPTVTLNTAPIEDAKMASVKALEQALASVVANIGQARTNTNQAYGQAKDSTQGAYDHIVGNSRREGKKAAVDSGDYAQEAMSNAASVALAGTNQDMTNSDDLLAKAAANLGGNKAVVKAVDKNVDPNNSTETIRNNISQNYQDSANNAASQTARDINASGRMADTIASDGAGAISNLMAELANRNNQYDRDLVDARNTNASNTANIQSSYADKLMQAQLAQQQEQNSLNNSAWQTNVANDSNALQGMIDLIGGENKSRMEQELMAAEAMQKQSSNSDRSRNDQLEILLKGLVSNTDKNTLGQEDIMELLRQIQG